MKEYSAQEWLPSASGLGESPLYRAIDKTFFFVDIKSQLVHQVPVSGRWEQRKTYEFDQPITRLEAVANRTDVLAVQTRLGIALLSLETGTLKDIATIQHGDRGLDAKVRMNDGAVDAKGRWWAGSMALDEEESIGRLWCMDKGPSEASTASVRELDNLVETPVPNGPVFSSDDKIMYVSETPGGKIFKYDYDTNDGSVSNKRLFVKLENGGMPDGMAVDADDHVWVAANSRGKLVRYSPSGEAVATCVVPGAKMTSCPAFGGDDLRTLFITSIASDGSSGHVYKFQVDTPGIKRHEYKS
ncbi:calcium homeostasis protein Regucalcin [Diaporthe helianthi]|uniref:Calcium homeostasis protein Regucalcin n=1 Tax=Diaporthe helianthi TaxID=158607 RepID=A0A2P5HI61_DIAHE|nr:calcium homeostasis protein Regucalcin [Diaporthe helianthi]